jgi:hypothetical protein
MKDGDRLFSLSFLLLAAAIVALGIVLALLQ